MDKRFLVVLNKNGSVNVIPESAESPSTSAALLVAVFLVALSLNALLAVTLFTLRRRRHDDLLAHILVVHTLDCLLNLTAALVFLLAAPHAGSLCRVNAATAQLAQVVQGLLMAALSVELVREQPVKGVTLRRALPAILWLYATMLVVPMFATQDIAVLHFQQRLSCAPAPHQLYVVMVLVLGHLLPWLVTAAGVAMMVRRAMLHMDSEWAEARFHMLLTLCYFALVVPYVLSASASQLAWRELPRASPGYFVSSSDSISTGEHDTALTWCRFSFLVVAPLAVLAVEKEVRKQCALLICCRRDNAVLSVDAQLKWNNTLKRRRKPKTESRMADYRTPVLFATSEGLHLRVVDENVEPAVRRQWLGDNDNRAGSEKVSYRLEFCDVALVTTTPINDLPGRLLRHPAIVEEEVVDDGSPRNRVVRFAETIAEIPASELTTRSDGDVDVNPSDIVMRVPLMSLESSLPRSLLSRAVFPPS